MTFVKDLTGLGKTDGATAMYGADLGIMRRDPNRGNLPVACFGDNFELRYLKGEWRSPTFFMYNEQLDPLGVPLLDHLGKPAVDSQGRAAQAFPYVHDPANVHTHIPTDFIWHNGKWVMQTIAMAPGLVEKRGEFRTSPDLVTWSDPILTHNYPIHPGAVMLTFDRLPGSSYVYIFGTGGLARNRPIWLWRCPAAEFPLGWWEPYGKGANGVWAWGTPNEATPILAGAYGELSFRYLEGDSKQRAVLAYFDARNYRVAARLIPGPDPTKVVGSKEYVVATGSQFPQLYGGYVAPQSKADVASGLQLVVSQWKTSTNDPYKASLHKHTIGTTSSGGWWPWAA